MSSTAATKPWAKPATCSKREASHRFSYHCLLEPGATSGTFSKTPGGAWTHTGARTRGLTRITQREPHYLRTIKPTRRTPNINILLLTSVPAHEDTNAHYGHLTIVRPLQRHMHNTCTPLPRHDPVPSTPRAEHSDFSEILNSYKLYRTQKIHRSILSLQFRIM